LKAAKTLVSKKEEEETEEKNFYFWEIKGKKKQKNHSAVFLFERKAQSGMGWKSSSFFP
jgi:hypothetical protein